jgi:hypothetical protein
MAILEKRFNFIRDDLFLTAWVDTESGKQKLLMQKTDLNDGKILHQDEIDCIHTTVMDIPEENFKETVLDPNFEKNIMKIRSTEFLPEVTLDPEEKFSALKSWVEGIAEAGLEAFKLQAEIEAEWGLMFAVSWKIMRFLALIDQEIMLEYIASIERECRFEGELHEASLIANLSPILDMIMIDLGRIISESSSDQLLEIETAHIGKFEDILNYIFDMEPPLSLFLHNLRYAVFLKFPGALKIPDIKRAFFHRNSFVKKVLLLNPNISELDVFDNFLSSGTEPDQNVRAMAAHHPDAASFEKFKNFLSITTENSSKVRSVAAKHPNATKFPEYAQLLSIKTEPRSKVRKVAADHEGAVKFPEYRNLLSFKTEPDHKVRVIAAGNVKAQRLVEYQNFLSDETEPNTLVRIVASRKSKERKNTQIYE